MEHYFLKAVHVLLMRMNIGTEADLLSRLLFLAIDHDAIFFSHSLKFPFGRLMGRQRGLNAAKAFQ